jgi:hypothetical protein
MFDKDFYGNNNKWFTGIVRVVDSNRVKVRIFGIHHMEDTVNVSDNDLPWATVVYPIDATTDGMFLEPDHWVVGFFADGDNCQQPIVTGKIGFGPSSAYETGSKTFRRTGSGFDAGGGSGGGRGGGIGGGIDRGLDAYTKTIPGGSNPEKVFNYLTTKFVEQWGMPVEQAKKVAAGIVGSLQGESGTNLVTNSHNWVNEDSYGIAQWNRDAGRLGPLEEMCGVGSTDLGCQLDYLWWELHNHDQGIRTARKLKTAKTVDEATIIWTVFFEVPRDRYTRARERLPNGRNAYKQLAPRYKPIYADRKSVPGGSGGV